MRRIFTAESQSTQRARKKAYQEIRLSVGRILEYQEKRNGKFCQRGLNKNENR
jgi:hypothetical protein